MKESLVGLDVGGSSIKAVSIRGGVVVGEATSSAYARPDAETLRSALTDVIGRLRVCGDETTHVGLCVPGILNEARTQVVHAVNLPGLVGMDLAGQVREVLPECAGVRVMSDAYASAFGFWARGRRPGRLLALVIGTGVGACVLDDGRPLNVVDECPGHIGQIDVGACGAVEAPIGPDGGRGSLEAYIGASALTLRFADDRVAGLLEAPDDDPAFEALARAIRICHAVYGPNEIALLGGVGTRLSARLTAIDALVRRDLTSVARSKWRLVCGDSDRYGAEGAARLGREPLA